MCRDRSPRTPRSSPSASPYTLLARGESVGSLSSRRPDVTPSDLAAAAARTALADAGREPGEPIFAGITKDYLEPAAAKVVADAVGAAQARVFDVMNALSGGFSCPRSPRA